jgi:predicted permease
VALLVTIFGSILVALVFIFVVYRIIANQKSVDSGVQMTSTAPPDNSVPDHVITGVTADAFGEYRTLKTCKK